MLKVDFEERISIMEWYLYKAVLALVMQLLAFLHANMYYAALKVCNITIAGKRECLGWYRLYMLTISCAVN